MKQKVLVGALIVLGVAVTLFFGLRAFHAFRLIRQRRPPPAIMDVELIRGWMTVPFIARGYHVPGPYIFEALKIPANGNERTSLDNLNSKYYPGKTDYVLAQVKLAIQTFRETHPPPPGAHPPPGPAPTGSVPP